MNSFRKIGPDTWGLACDDEYEPGTRVTVALKSGATKQVTVGPKALENQQYGKWVYTILPEHKETTQHAVGNLTGVLGLLQRAAKRLKFPAITLSVPAINETIRVNIAGPQARVPGSLTVVSQTRTNREGRDLWYGRVETNGQFTSTHEHAGVIADRLAELAADPVRVAAEHGRLTGLCCFCHLPLGRGDDKRSVDIGYGPTCAKNFGLPWGTRAATKAGPVLSGDLPFDDDISDIGASAA